MKDEILRNFKRNTFFLSFLVKDLNEDDVLIKTGSSNNIGWIIGHLVLGRGKILIKLNKECDIQESEKAFERYVEKNQYTKINKEELVQGFISRGKRLFKAIKELNETKLLEPIEFKLPDGGDNLGSYLSFVAWHESFHLGQIDLIKAANGFDGIK
jgi:hypothetical protein